MNELMKYVLVSTVTLGKLVSKKFLSIETSMVYKQCCIVLQKGYQQGPRVAPGSVGRTAPYLAGARSNQLSLA
jgi:hypothetical protein